MGAKKGTLPGGKKTQAGKGRPKGAKSKFTNLKQSFLDAYKAKDGFGGDLELKKFAKDNRETFLNMVTKLLPKAVEGTLTLENPPTINITFSDDQK